MAYAGTFIDGSQNILELRFSNLVIRHQSEVNASSCSKIRYDIALNKQYYYLQLHVSFSCYTMLRIVLGLVSAIKI